MIVINDFTELKSNPRNGGISAASFGASKFCSHIDAASKLVAVWSDNNSGEELNFKIYDFDRELKFSLQGPIIYAKFEPRAAQIWLARRDGDQQISILIYDYNGGLKSNLALPDELTLDGETREFMLGGIVPLNEKIWLVRDDGYFRHYLFDAIKFEFIAEIALAGFEPKIDGAGEITSQICDIDYREGKVIFTHYELAGEGEQMREINRYFEADIAALGQIFTTKRTRPLKI